MTTAELKKTANEVRKGIIKSTHAAKSGHPGGSLSAADVFTYLYFVELNVDPKNPKDENKRIFPKRRSVNIKTCRILLTGTS